MYIVVKSHDVLELTNIVNKKMLQGLDLVGGMSSDNHGLYVQTLSLTPERNCQLRVNYPALKDEACKSFVFRAKIARS